MSGFKELLGSSSGVLASTSVEDSAVRMNPDPFRDVLPEVRVLSMRRRVDRRANMASRLDRAGITTYSWFEGEDGSEAHYQQLWWQHQARNQYSSVSGSPYRIPSSGSLAILYSMRRMLTCAIRDKTKALLVLQDDVLFHKDFRELASPILSAAFAAVPSWKLIYLGANQPWWRGNMTTSELVPGFQSYCPSGAADGAFAVAIHSSMFHFLLNEIDEFRLPFDSGPLKAAQRAFPEQCIAILPNLIVADVTDSDCRPSRSQAALATRLRWDMDLYDSSSSG